MLVDVLHSSDNDSLPPLSCLPPGRVCCDGLVVVCAVSGGPAPGAAGPGAGEGPGGGGQGPAGEPQVLQGHQGEAAPLHGDEQGEP